jgi:hypothetical protein
MSPEEVVRARALRAHGYSARQIARVLGVPRAAVAAVVRRTADSDRGLLAGADLKACWVSSGWSSGLLVDERFRWPDLADPTPHPSGLAAVLVARYAGPDTVSACGYLVDLYCLGVKDVIGPRILNDQQHAQFTRAFFAGFRQAPIAAPIELAQQLVLGSARYAHSLGFEPAPGFESVRGHLGEWSGVRAITFGRHGRPEYIQGPYDDAPHIRHTLHGNPPAGEAGKPGDEAMAGRAPVRPGPSDAVVITGPGQAAEPVALPALAGV